MRTLKNCIWIVGVIFFHLPSHGAGRALPPRENRDETPAHRAGTLQSYVGSYVLAAEERSRNHDTGADCPEILRVRKVERPLGGHGGYLHFEGLKTSLEINIPGVNPVEKTQDFIYPLKREDEGAHYWKEPGQLNRYGHDRERGGVDQVVTRVTQDMGGLVFQINRREFCARFRFFCIPLENRFFGDTVQCGYLFRR